jgi:hypothetical protein
MTRAMPTTRCAPTNRCAPTANPPFSVRPSAESGDWA